jgi:putative hydrolase of the HAD superfamily
MTAPKALLLDAMGTLIGLRRSVGEFYAEVAREHGLELAPEQLDNAFIEAYRQAPPLAFPATAPAHLEQAERHWWQQRIQQTFQGAGVSQLPMGLGSDLFDRFASPEPWAVYPEVVAALGRWRHRGLKLVVVSNFDQRLHRLLALLGLRELLDGVLVSSALGVAKPDPAPLQRALAMLELGPNQAWHLGDSAADRQAAAAAGIRYLHLNRPGGLIVRPAAPGAPPDAMPFAPN